MRRRIRALEPQLRALQRAFARELACPSAVYRVMDTTLVPAMVRVRASRRGPGSPTCSRGTGWGGIRRALLGSVSESVIKHAHCPVLVVRE
ncbi:MAG TPA: universal stress protein [Rubrobacter sp.]|nr:universal stress protein [Rubrobacter sp.]